MVNNEKKWTHVPRANGILSNPSQKVKSRPSRPRHRLEPTANQQHYHHGMADRLSPPSLDSHYTEPQWSIRPVYANPTALSHLFRRGRYRLSALPATKMSKYQLNNHHLLNMWEVCCSRWCLCRYLFSIARLDRWKSSPSSFIIHRPDWAFEFLDDRPWGEK